MIRFEDVTKIYPGAERPAVDGVSLEVPPGAFVVLLGPSGCGKTTLLKMVNRLYEPTSGVITLAGQDIRALEVSDLRRRIGYVIQQVGLFPHMTVAQNIAVVPDLLGWSKARQQARVDELLELVGLPPAEYRARYPAQLSGGQQQRVGLARALAADPQVMLMDEPFGAIDAITRASLQDEMVNLQRRLRKTILFVTHDVEEALRLADWIVILKQGRLVQFAPPCDIINRPADDFVRELVNSDDRVRQLSLLQLEDILQPLGAKTPPRGAPRLDVTAPARQALSLLLQPGVSLVVLEQDGQPVGLVTLDLLRGAACGEDLA